MSLKELAYLVQSDLYRYTENFSFWWWLRKIAFGESYNSVLWFRIGSYVYQHKWLKPFLYPFIRLIIKYYGLRYGLFLKPPTQIGPGFYVGHYGNMLVGLHCKLGRNVNISPGVTIGANRSGKNKGYPTLGNNIYIGPGAKILGAVTIGNNVAIGANCVVTKDVPDGVLVVGNPAHIKGRSNIHELIHKTDYDEKLRKPAPSKTA